MSSPNRELYRDSIQVDSADAPGGVVAYYADGDQEIIHTNRYILDLFECKTIDEFLEFTQGSFRNFVYEGDFRAIQDSIWGQVRQHEGLEHVYYRIQTKSGRLVTVADYGRLVLGEGKRPTFHAFISEITPEVTVDWLTGLPTMTRFHELARMGAQRLFERGERPVAVALDIMGMKSFNTRYGREEGDRLLRALAGVLRKYFGNESCSRFAEDHFYAFASDRDIVERIHAVFESYEAQAFDNVPPLRVGLFVCDPDDDIVASGFDHAKAACDVDRKTYDSHMMWFTDEMRTAVRLRNHVLTHLDQAIEQGWIRPYYQQIVRSSTGDVCNEEALARWIDPKYGSLYPDQFIPDLEEAGLLHRLDLHIVDCVVADMGAKRAQGVPVVPVSINFSPRDLSELNLADEISQRLDAAALPHGLIRVELTESAASSDPDFLRAQIESLHQAGFEVWMDDFGSGYSSLNTLQEFDFDLIKFDMGFLRSSRVDRAYVILENVVRAAARLGIDTLTEGVETEEQAEFLAGIGCDMLQGYFYAKPCSIEEIVRDASSGMRREPFLEKDYWHAVSLANFAEMAKSGDARNQAPMKELLIGVLEHRGDDWILLRSNAAYLSFLQSGHLLPSEASNLRAYPVNLIADDDFCRVAEKTKQTGVWEQIFGSVTYGLGYHFYLRHVASTDEADAFMVSAVPTMLGSGLGVYGDVPVAYAVFRLQLDDERSRVLDATYVYANGTYCEWCNVKANQVIGHSFLEVYPDSGDMWFPYCYRAVVEGEQVHDVVFGPEVGHWLSINIVPSLTQDCCIFAFSLADDMRLEHDVLQMSLDTSELIVRIARAFNTESNFDVAMYEMLAAVSDAIHPDRMYVLEYREYAIAHTYEWCAEGVASQIAELESTDPELYRSWKRLGAKDPIVLLPDIEQLRDEDELLYQHLLSRGITRLLAVPLYEGKRLVGYIGADNYLLDERLDSIHLLKAVATFVSTRLVNHRLVQELMRLGESEEEVARL